MKKKSRFNLRGLAMREDLIDNLDFTEEDYDNARGEWDTADFNEFIDNVIDRVQFNKGTLDDAIRTATETYKHMPNNNDYE